MPFDTIIRGGTVATAADTFRADVAIRDGKIAALGHDLGPADTIIDATDRLVLPGGPRVCRRPRRDVHQEFRSTALG